MAWTNEDGLLIRFNRERGDVTNDGSTSAEEKILKFAILDATTLADADTEAEAGDRPYIPAGAVIKDAYIIVSTAFTSGGAAVLDVGTKQAAGTTIDDDGIDAAVALAALGANAVVACDGALIGTKVTADSYLTTTYDTAAFTAGAAEIVVKYILV